MVLFLSLAMIFLASCNKEYRNKGETKKEITKKDYIKYEDTFYETFDTIVSFSCYTTSEDEFEGYKKLLEIILKNTMIFLIIIKIIQEL